MDVLPAAVSLITEAMLVSARWAGRRRRFCLEQAAAVSDHSRIAELEAHVLLLEDLLALRDAHIRVLQQRLGKGRVRRPYPLAERLRILWLTEYFQIPGRRLREMLGVSRSSVHRWLGAFRKGRTGKRRNAWRAANRTPEEIAEFIWEIFTQNPTWGRHRIAMTLWVLGVFVSATTVRDVLRRPRRRKPAPAAAAAKRRRRGPVWITATHPNHTWSLDRTLVYRWGLWPTWVLVAIDHYSRKVTALSPLYGSDGRWVITAMERAFSRHGPPGLIVTDRDPLFTSGDFQQMLRRWGVRQEFGSIGKHGSVPVTERVILTLKREWLKRVHLIRGMDHLERLLDDFVLYYTAYRSHMTLGGAVPDSVHRGEQWCRPEPSAKTLPPRIERRHFADARLTAFRVAA